MSDIHILDGNGGNLFTVVVHVATPNGSNIVGTSWVDAIKNSGRAKSILTVGNGRGQISNAEMNSILAGSIIEGVLQWEDDPAWTNQQRTDDIAVRAAQLKAQLLHQYARELKFFGHIFSAS